MSPINCIANFQNPLISNGFRTVTRVLLSRYNFLKDANRKTPTQRRDSRNKQSRALREERSEKSLFVHEHVALIATRTFGKGVSEMTTIPTDEQFQIKDETAQNYRKKATSLLHEAAREYDVDIPSISQIVEFMLGKRHRISKSAWVSYRSSVVFFLRSTAPGIGISADAVERAVLKLKEADLSVCPRPSRTSTLKSKGVTIWQYKTLLNELKLRSGQTEKTKTPERTRWLFEGGLLMGLRPCEWESCMVLVDSDGLPLLQIVTAKIKKGEAKTIRQFPLRSDTSLLIVRKNLSLIKEWKSRNPYLRFSSYIHSCRNFLRTVVRETFGRDVHITLYDSRHQFASNMRGLGFSQEKIAQLLGHKKIKNSSLYGKRSSSWIRHSRKSREVSKAVSRNSMKKHQSDV